MYIDSFKKEATNKDYSLCGFGNVLIASQAKGSAKSVTFPLGFDESAPDTNLAFKVVFSQGHDASNSTDYMTLNGIQVDANVNGTLQPLPIHAMDESGTTVYKVLDPNTVLEMYYTSDDGSGNPAFVVIGNPLVLSSTTYSIYANGQSESEHLSEVEVIYTWADTRFSNYFPYVCPYDGFLYFGIETSYNRSITINGIEIFSTSGSANKFSYSTYVSKGDIFSIQMIGPTDSATSMFSARFYKEREL